VTLAEQLVLMELLLSRTTTISKEEKAKIEGSLKMYDPLWGEDDPCLPACVLL